MEKTCSSCNVTKPLDMFERAFDCQGGHRGQCKDCRNRTAYKRQHEGRKHQVSYRMRNNKNLRLYRLRHPERIRAHTLARTHKNELIKDACELCSSTGPLHMHHPDYSKPLEVITLCIPCHESAHHRGALV